MRRLLLVHVSRTSSSIRGDASKITEPVGLPRYLDLSRYLTTRSSADTADARSLYTENMPPTYTPLMLAGGLYEQVPISDLPTRNMLT